MKKLLVAGVLGVALMFTASTQVATAAAWRPAYRGHAYGQTAYRTTFNHFDHGRFYGGYGHYYGPSYRNYGYDRCW